MVTFHCEKCEAKKVDKYSASTTAHNFLELQGVKKNDSFAQFLPMLFRHRFSAWKVNYFHLLILKQKQRK